MTRLKDSMGALFLVSSFAVFILGDPLAKIHPGLFLAALGVFAVSSLYVIIHDTPAVYRAEDPEE